MTLRFRLRQCLRRVGRSARKSSGSEANTDVKSTTSLRGYAFKGGLVWKGGVNPAVSQITERPPPPLPFAGTGGVRPVASSRPPCPRPR